jgi:2-iminobutanoate/2-iminopropanoate deaminase
MSGMSKLTTIQSPHVPGPVGHYSHAIAHGGVLYVSGQLGRTSDMSAEEAGDIEAQTRRALSSVEAIVRSAGSDASCIVKVNLYISDVSLWPAVNAAYAAFFAAHRPARTIVPTGRLHYDALIEIEAIAAVG